jgi:glutamate-1-semialdehyde 2,1-aminomutase
MKPIEEYLYLPKDPKDVSEEKVHQLLEKEKRYYLTKTEKSRANFNSSKETLPLGVPSSFQYWDPYPIAIKKASGAYLIDLDDQSYLDLSMGFGALQIGHTHPTLTQSIKSVLEDGLLYVSPSALASEAAKLITKRFKIDQVRFTNSGTESIMYAIRTAKVFTQRDGLLKIEGGYHGGFDPSMVSTKPNLETAGSADCIKPVIAPGTTPGDVTPIPFNDLNYLTKVLEIDPTRYAALLIEPIMENIGIVLPDENYLSELHTLLKKYGVLLIIDEIKTGYTAGPNGASALYGITPDLITLAKSIGGGIAVGAFGGKQEIMEKVTNNQSSHYGTYNGNTLAAQAIITVDKILTPELLKEARQRNIRTLFGINTIIENYQLPAHTVGFGSKGSVVWKPEQIRNYRDYKGINFELAELNWLWNINRNIITPPGLDEQWLVSIQHTDQDMQKLVDSFESLAVALRSP